MESPNVVPTIISLEAKLAAETIDGVVTGFLAEFGLHRQGKGHLQEKLAQLVQLAINQSFYRAARGTNGNIH